MSLQRRVAWLLLPVMLYLSGCAAMVRYESPSLKEAKASTTTTIRSLGYFWGIVAPSPISLEQCGTAGIKKMKVKQGFIDGLITYATLGIVISYKVKLKCAAPQDTAPAPEPAS